MTENSSTTHHVDEQPEFDIECPECGHDEITIKQERDVSHRGPIGARQTRTGKWVTTVGCARCPWTVEVDEEELEDIDVFEWGVTRTESTLDYEELFEIAKREASDG